MLPAMVMAVLLPAVNAILRAVPPVGLRPAPWLAGRSAASTALATRGPMPGSPAISASEALASLRTEPKCRSSVARRAGPSPGTESSSLTARAFDRFARWYVIAKRCASSRTRCSRYRPSLVRGRITGESSPGSQTSSSRLARPHARDVVDAELTERAGRGGHLGRPAVDHDQVGRVGELTLPRGLGGDLGVAE